MPKRRKNDMLLETKKIYARDDGTVIRIDTIDDLIYYYTIIEGDNFGFSKSGEESFDYISNHDDMKIVTEAQQKFYEEELALIKL